MLSFKRTLAATLIAGGLVTTALAQTAAAPSAAGAASALPAANPASAPLDAGSPAAPAAKPAAKLEFAKMRSQLMPGDKIGHMEGGIFCLNNGDMHASEAMEAAVNSLGAMSFKRELKTLGLGDASSEISAFDNGQPSDADYRVGGVLLSLNDSECVYPGGRKGSIELTVKWDIFSTRQQRVVMSKTTSGSHAIGSFQNITGRDFILLAMGQSIDALLTDPEVKALLAGAAAPLPAVALAPLKLTGGRPYAGGTKQNATLLKDAVVTILSDKGSGSGFYVAEGYLLTNRHVVGTAKYVKVKLENGKELVGEVVREDAARDVALLKTEAAGVPVLPLRLADPAVGEDVYAIGSPLTQKLSGTFTQGVLSGVRETEGLRFLQSDVAVNPGNSGGPLLDGAGNVVGMTTLKIANSAGLAFFVPMRDATERLALAFTPPGP